MARFIQFKYLEIGAVLAVILLAALLRLGYAGVNPFASDEARLSVLALEMGREGHVVSAGIPNSAGSRNLPASVYVFVPPYLLSTDPLIATQYVGLLNVLAIIGLWWVTRQGSGALVAWMTALFAATAPFAVFFSRNIWTQNLLFPMAILWLIMTFIAITTTNLKHKRFCIGGVCFIAGFAFQVHLAGAALGLATLYSGLRWRWWRNLFAVLSGGGIAVLALVPFVYQAICCSPELLAEYGSVSGVSGLDAGALLYTLQLSLNRGWDYLAAGDLARHGSNLVPQILSAIMILMGSVALAQMQSNSALHQNKLNSKILFELSLLLLSTPIALFTYHRAPVRLHYVLTALPALAIIAGASVTLFKKRWWQAVIIGLMFALAAIWSYQIWDSLAIVNQQTAPQGMNEPLKAPRAVASSLPDDGRIVVMHTQSSDYYQRGEPAIWKVLLWDRPHRITNGWSLLLLPDEPAYLMTEIDGIHAWQEMEDTGIMDENFIQYDPMAGAQVYYMQPYDGEKLPQQTIWLDEPITFDTGLQLLGWYTRRVHSQVRVSMLYQAVSNPPDDPSLRQFTHLRYAAEVEAGNISDPAYIDDVELTQSWRQGDRLIVLAAFTPEENSGTFYVDVGQYALNSGQRYQHSQNADFLRFGSFEWSREE